MKKGQCKKCNNHYHQTREQNPWNSWYCQEIQQVLIYTTVTQPTWWWTAHSWEV